MGLKYQLTVWRSSYVELACFRDFNMALMCYAALRDETKQLINLERADGGSDGLTEGERLRLLRAT